MTDDLIAREAQAFSTFEAAVAAVPRDLREEPALPDGWCVKDVLWHVAYWWRDAEVSFAAMRAGTYLEDDGGDDETDATNARVLSESRAMSLADVEAGLIPARAGMLAALEPVMGDPVAEELFVSETIEHYADHLSAVLGLGAT